MEEKQYQVMILLETSREYGRGLLRGVSRYSREQGNWLIERPPYFYQSDSASLDAFVCRPRHRIDGIIMRDLDIELPESMRQIPVVYASYRTDAYANGVAINTRDDQLAEAVFDHFLSKGISDMAFLGYEDMFWSISRKRALEAIATSRGVPVSTYDMPSQVEQEGPAPELIAWLKGQRRPTGLMACNDDCGQYAIAVCRSAGLQVPQDIAIVGVDNDEFVCGMSNPPMSSVSLNLEAVGHEAAERLHMMMAGGEGGPTIYVEPSGVITRQSSDLLATADPMVVEAVQYIYDHADEGILVNDIQRELAVARRVLYGKFKENLGCSVHQFIKKVRVNRVKTLLRETDLTINQIAHQMGFPGADHIAKYFRSVQGENPSDYRKKHQ